MRRPAIVTLAETPLEGRRALIAARKSNKKVGVKGGEGINLTTQDEKSRGFCVRNGMTIVDVAKDIISGRVAPIDRKELGAWLSDPAKRAQFDCIVAYAGDRLSRGEDTDWSRIETWAADHGKTLILIDEGGTGVHYPARGDSDFWQWSAVKRQSSQEWHAIHDRIAAATCTIMSAGGWCGTAPFGYTITGEIYRKHLQVIEALRPIIATVFTMAIAGDSLRVIADWLSASEIKTERGQSTWNEGAVRQMIQNDTYSGTTNRHCAGCDSTHPLGAPAIVDMATQKRAQAALKSRARGKARTGGRPSGNPAMLVPLCVNCGVGMYRTGPTKVTNKAGRTYFKPAYYSCKMRTKDGQRVGCRTTVRCDATDNAVNAIMASETADEMTVSVTYPAAALESAIEAVRRDERAAFERDDFGALQDYRETRLKLEDELEDAETELVATVSTGRTIGDVWNALKPSERRDWLKLRAITVELGKDAVTVHMPGSSQTAIGRTMSLTAAA